MSKRSFRQKDIAEKLGISTVTVSNALSGKKGVSEQLRQRILTLAIEEGYEDGKVREAKDIGKDEAVKDTVMEPEREGSSAVDETGQYDTEFRGKTAGILIPGRYISIGTSFYWEMYRNIAYSLSRRAVLSSLEILTEMKPDSPLPRCLQEPDMPVIIIGRLNRPYLDRLMEKAQHRILLMDCRYPEYDCSAVLSSNFIGMYRSTQYLIDHGHRDIGFLGTPETSSNIAERFYGYRKCLLDNGIIYHPEWLLRDRDPVNETPGITLPDRMPTAVASSSDYAAGFLSDCLSGKGLGVPEDLSVTSYDDYLYDHPLGKILTTFHVDMGRMAEAAADIITMTNEPASRVIYVDGPLIERSSVRDHS